MFDILAVCLILGLSLSIAVIFRRKIEECIPVVVLSISTILFLSGMLNSLLVGLYIIWALSLISLLYFIINYRKISLIDIATPGLLYFVGIFAISLLWHRYRVVKTWDELAQWALTVKNSFELDKFATVIESNAIYRDYPPASGLFHYFWMKVGNLFIDSRLYISMTMLISSFLVPVLKNYSFKQWKKLVFIFPILFLAPFAFYNTPYTSLTVDCLMGMIFAYILYSYFNDKSSVINKISIGLGLFILPIIKSSGLIFAEMASIIIIVDTLLIHSKFNVNNIIACIACIILPFVSNQLWSINLRLNSVGNSFSTNSERIVYIKTSLQGWQLQGFYDFFKAIFNYKILKDTQQTVFHIGPFDVSAIIWIIVIAMMLSILIYIQGMKKRDLILYTIVFVGGILYTASVSILYLAQFSAGEVAILSSFSRYISTYWLAVYLFFSYSIIKYLSAVDLKISIILIAVLLFVPHVQIENTFLSLFSKKQGYIESKRHAAKINLRNKIDEVLPKITSRDKLHVFNGSIADYVYWLAPISVPSPLWQSADFGFFNDFAERLGYSYVFFDDMYGTIETKEFKDKFGYLFDDKKQIMDLGLYKVYFEEKKPHLKFIADLHSQQKYVTEPPFDNLYWNNTSEGVYVNVVSGEPLFSSRDKEDGGVGWPCFTKPLVMENVSGKYENGAEVRSSYRYGKLYLGHVYSDSSKPAHLRYCIDSGNLLFIPRQELKNDWIFTEDIK